MKLAGLKKSLDEKNKEGLPGEVNTTNQPLSYTPHDEELFHYYTAEDLGEDDSGSTPENILGVVHVSKPSIKHVFFLLRPFLKPILEAFSKQQQDLDRLVKLLSLERVFSDMRANISANVAYECNYQGRKFLYLYTTQPLTLVVTPGGQTISAGASVWVPLAFPAGTKITAQGVSDQNPVGITVRACDVPMALFAQLIAGVSTLIGNVGIVGATGNQLSIGATGNITVIQGNAAAGGLATQWGILQTQHNATVAVGAGNTVIKNSAAQLGVIVVTTAGTTGFTAFDNASTNAGTQLYNSKAAPALGDIYFFMGEAANGITIANTATGPALTVYYT